MSYEACEIAAHELFLFIINSNGQSSVTDKSWANYKYKRFLAEMKRALSLWVTISQKAADDYTENEITSDIFNSATILLTASKLAAYYEQEITE